jgi:hypothetical protein
MEVSSIFLWNMTNVTSLPHKSVPLSLGPSDHGPTQDIMKFHVHSCLLYLSEHMLFSLSLQVLSYIVKKEYINILGFFPFLFVWDYAQWDLCVCVRICAHSMKVCTYTHIWVTGLSYEYSWEFIRITAQMLDNVQSAVFQRQYYSIKKKNSIILVMVLNYHYTRKEVSLGSVSSI